MSSVLPVTCPKCGRGAEFHADDGITYCTSVRCGWYGIADADRNYKPPQNRGGPSENGEADQ